MKISFIMILFIVDLLAFSNNSLAFSNNLVVTNVKTSKKQMFEEVFSKAKLLKHKTQENRRDFEPLSVYEKRIKEAVYNYNKFLDNEYRIGCKPDEVKLDWENSNVQIIKNSNIRIIRNRGMSNSIYGLHLVIPVTPIVARQLKVFPNAITIICNFKISRNLELIIEHLKIEYREKVIYEE